MSQPVHTSITNENKTMVTLLTAYIVAGAAIGGYAVWLMIGTRRLSRRVQQLKSVTDDTPDYLPAKKIA
jgi:hypothetical protein